MKKIIFSVAFLCVFIGCRNNISINSYEQSEPETVAEAYISKIISVDSMFSRSVKTDLYPDFLYEMEIEDEEGNKIEFSEFSEEEKNIFFEDWKKDYTEELTKKFVEDTDLAEMVEIENQAFKETVESISGNRAIKSQNLEDFFNIYEKKLSKIANKVEKNRSSSSSSSSNSSNEITSDCLVKSSVERFKANYEKGNFLVCKDSSSSSGSSSSYIGHSSMMYKDKWEVDWNTDGLGKATITSSPKNKSAQWPGKIDGVQYEPIGYWAGNASGSANSVSIYKPQGTKKIWCVFFTYGKIYKIGAKEREKAVQNATKHLGKEYTYTYMAKWRMDKFYCSQLVWRSWYDVNSVYDLSIGKWIPWVSPLDLACSQNSIHLVSYKNKG